MIKVNIHEAKTRFSRLVELAAGGEQVIIAKSGKPFARLVSGIQIFGDARTWWRQAIGKYETGFQPKTGAVLCFKPTARLKLGHVAVVSQVLTDRIVQITHANWSPIEGSRGKVEKDVTLVDVSPAGDWSQVKVWYDPNRDLGGSTYSTEGFIYPDAKLDQGN